MNGRRLLAWVSILLVTSMLAACGGGGTHSGDISPSSPPVSVASGPDSFLLFPNPQVQPDGSRQTDTVAYAAAYYAAIDPTNAKDTLAKWKVANGFDTPSGRQFTVVFGDKRDLGYGRRMTGRQNADGSVAFLVENYLTNPGGAYAYSPLSLDAAVVQDARWRILVNAVEFSAGPDGGVPFAKFFNFNIVTGNRELMVDLDGRGAKAMPGPCITCHGGRGDALMPPDASGLPRFNLLANVASKARGDVQAQLAPFEVDTFDFSDRSGFTRDVQEAMFKALNQLVLCTYPIPDDEAAPRLPEDICRRTANGSEWQGTAAGLIKRAYGGDTMPAARFADVLVPSGWSSEPTLYRDVVVPSCRACHQLRGSAGNSDIDFDSFDKFTSYADRIKAHVIDRGNMPLAKVVYDTFWAPGSNQPELLATFLQGQGFGTRELRDAAGAVLRPGRPVADPGPDRVVFPGATTLSAAASLFATSYSWSVVSGPGNTVPPVGATLADPNSMQPTFTAGNGTYVVQLIASNGSTQSAPVRLTLVVDPSLTQPPSALRFADIKKVLQGPAGCYSCHNANGGEPLPPVLFGDAAGKDIDRNGDGVIDITDDAWFHAEIRGRANFTDLGASTLLRKPAGFHHGGLAQLNFDVTVPPGATVRQDYDRFLGWMLNGAPR